MPSQKLASGENLLKGELAAAWNILEGSSGDYTDLGIARRFGGSAAAYSLRDIGAMNGRVVKVRRDSDDAEEDFSANQVASGALETWVQDDTDYDIALTDWSDDPTAPYGSAFTSNGKDGYTVDYSAGVASTRARWQFRDNVASGDTIFYSFNASITSGTPAIITKQADGTSNAQSSSVAISNGFNSGSITTNAEAVYFAIGDTEGTQNFTISDFRVSLTARNGFVETWYDQSGNGEDMTQSTDGKQPSIVINGGQVKDYNGNNSIDFVSGSARVLDKSGTTTAKTCIIVLDEDSSGTASRAILGFSDSTSFMRLDATIDVELKAGGSTANYRAMPTNVTSLYFWFTNGTDEDKLFANNVDEGDTTANTPPNLPFTRIGARNSDSDPYNSRITEVITFAEDLSADRTVLQNDINNNYNIF